MADTFRGWAVRIVGGSFVFSDTVESVADTWEARPCGECGLHNTPEGYDGCIGEIEGAINACCGHGVVEDAYVQYSQDSRIGGREARELFNERKDAD